MPEAVKYTTIDEYIQTVPAAMQSILEEIRQLIHAAVPTAVEAISYQMPAFKLNGKVLVYFAAWKHHLGFYATPAGNEAFQNELSPYKGAKGSVQFPLDKPIPYDLIRKIVLFRAEEISKKANPR